MEEKTNVEQEKREARRKRRKKNEILSYVTVLLVLALLTVGGIVAAKFLYNPAQEEKAAEEVANEIQQELSQQEEEVILTEPEPVEPEVTAPTADEIGDQIVTPIIEGMTLEEKVAGLFIVTPEAITGVDTATQAGDGTKKAIEEYPVGGIIYFSKNIQSKDQLTDMISKTASYCKYPMFFAVDEEGGDVARIANSSIEVEKTGPAADIAATGDPNKAYVANSVIASYLKELGFNLDFAPVADVASIEDSFIGNRAYGTDFNAAAPFVSNAVTGLQENGVSACLKHFPGLGATSGDTHKEMVTNERTSQDFKDNEFITFKAGIEAGTDFIMVSHISLPSITGDNTPCCLIPSIVTDMLRAELGYKGVVITDAMNMAAISEYYSSDEAAIKALKAGCDMILMPENFKEAYDGIIKAVREDQTLDEKRIDDALKRIYKVKYKEQIAEELAKY